MARAREHYPNCGYLNLMRSNDDIRTIHSKGKQLRKTFSFKVIDLRLLNIFCLKSKKVINVFRKFFKKDRYYDECKLCTERGANIIFLPCGHLYVCKQCATNLNKCPICRVEINQILKVYFP